MIKTVYICTDMEGLAGVDHWDQCYDPDDNSPLYRAGLGTPGRRRERDGWKAACAPESPTSA